MASRKTSIKNIGMLTHFHFLVEVAVDFVVVLAAAVGVAVFVVVVAVVGHGAADFAVAAALAAVFADPDLVAVAVAPVVVFVVDVIVGLAGLVSGCGFGYCHPYLLDPFDR